MGVAARSSVQSISIVRSRDRQENLCDGKDYLAVLLQQLKYSYFYLVHTVLEVPYCGYPDKPSFYLYKCTEPT